MKKLTAILLAIVLCLSLAACKSDKQDDTAAPAGDAQSKIRVGLIAGLTGFGDLSMNDQALLGCQMAEKDFGIEYKAVEPKDTTQVLDMIQGFVDDGYNIIIAAVPDYDDIIAEVAPTYPDVHFITVDSTLSMDNVMCVEYLTHQGSYLAGAAAAMNSKTGIIGAVGGMDLTVISRFIDAYIQGAQSINPDIQCIVKYVGTDYNAWADTTTAKSITLDMIDNGADVIFQIAGGAGLGTIEACKQEGVWAIGVNVDQEEIAPDNVLTSMLTVGEAAIYSAIKGYVENGTPISGTFQASLENGGVGIVYSKNLTDDQKTQLKAIEADIIAGKIDVVDAVNP
ncbi:MAG: BMP family ABC transporter substrate-binding protein [Oscillospiraceae bacterium]|nr:BMP family ABC transporter substrate-binding protein [Oscillospiraceae bacterium]